MARKIRTRKVITYPSNSAIIASPDRRTIYTAGRSDWNFLSSIWVRLNRFQRSTQVNYLTISWRMRPVSAMVYDLRSRSRRVFEHTEQMISARLWRMIAGIEIYDLWLVLVAWHGLRASRLCDISGTTNKQHLIKTSCTSF